MIPAPLAVIVTGYVPIGVDAPAVQASEVFTRLFPVVVPFTLKFIPEGTPVNVTVIVELNPPVKFPVEMIIVLAGPPSCNVIDETLTANEKFGFGATTRITETVSVCPLPVPVTVTGYVPGAALMATEKPNVTVPSPGAASVHLENAAATPAGNPVTAKLTAELKVP